MNISLQFHIAIISTIYMLFNIDIAQAIQTLDHQTFISPTLLIKPNGEPIYYEIDEYISAIAQEQNKVGFIMPIMVQYKYGHYKTLNASCLIYNKAEINKMLKTREFPILNLMTSYVHDQYNYNIQNFTGCFFNDKAKALQLFDSIPAIQDIKSSFYAIKENTKSMSLMSIVNSKDDVIIYFFYTIIIIGVYSILLILYNSVSRFVNRFSKYILSDDFLSMQQFEPVLFN